MCSLISSQDLAVLLDDRRPEHLGLARASWLTRSMGGVDQEWGWMQGSFSRELELAEEPSVEGQGQWHLTAPNGERAGQLPLEVIGSTWRMVARGRASWASAVSVASMLMVAHR